MFRDYAYSDPRTHPDRLDPDDFLMNGCVQFCQEQMDKAPPAVLDLYQVLYQLVLQAQSSKHLPGTVASLGSGTTAL
jgi:hypothetical protein